MSILPEAAKKYIGLTSEKEIACDPVERGAVRRYAQAIMDEDPIYSDSGRTCALRRARGPAFLSHAYGKASFGYT